MGDNIGPYHLIDVLGEGGFGVVFLAERRSPIVQRVALKVVKPGMDSRAIIARFEQERQALALLDHPNIARVFDAGATPLGRPYFVMEYVRGVPLTTFASARALSLRERLEMFIAVCRAVHHAHTHGLVHRDLKPSNILVADIDGKITPKVIDFGVVKALQATLTDKTVHTREGQAIGTPEYMSPEQAAASLGEVDARTDVYSLGVLLFELLTGRLPYDGAKLRSAPPGSLSKVIEMLPVTPAGRLDPQLRGDIETVILTAMHKDHARRYQSAGDLAADVERLLSGEPIEARRDNVVYVMRTRVRRAARRGPIGVTLAAWALATLLVIKCVHPLLFDLTSAGQQMQERSNALARRLVGREATMERTRVVALDMEAAPSELGKLAGVDGVRDEDFTSFRLVYSAVLQRLARAKPAAVLIDIYFRRDTGYDQPLADALGALDAAGVPWAATVERWPLGEGLPELAKPILGSPRRFGSPSVEPPKDPRYMDLAMRRERGEVAPSLEVFAYAAVHRPGAPFDLGIDDEKQRLDVIYWKADPQAPGLHTPLGKPDHIGLSSVQEARVADDRLGIEPNDVTCLVEFALPPDRALANGTISVAQLLRMDQDALAAWCAGRVVVLGNSRTDMPRPDIHELASGRVIAGAHILAAATEQVIRGDQARNASSYESYAIVACAAAAGALIGCVLPLRRRWLMLSVLAVVLAAGSMASYSFAGFMCNPGPVVLALVIGSELNAIARALLLGQQLLLQESRV
jgi:CHASE2 domain-containing sensor protein